MATKRTDLNKETCPICSTATPTCRRDIQSVRGEEVPLLCSHCRRERDKARDQRLRRQRAAKRWEETRPSLQIAGETRAMAARSRILHGWR